MSNDLSSKLTDSRYNQQSRGMSFVTNSDQRGSAGYVAQQDRERHAHGGAVGHDRMHLMNPLHYTAQKQGGTVSQSSIPRATKRDYQAELDQRIAWQKQLANQRNGEKTELAHFTPQEMSFLKANPGSVQDVTTKYKSIAKKGQGGDTKLGKISKKTAKSLNQLIHQGHEKVNPRTGLREYMEEKKYTEEEKKYLPQFQSSSKSSQVSVDPELKSLNDQRKRTEAVRERLRKKVRNSSQSGYEAGDEKRVKRSVNLNETGYEADNDLDIEDELMQAILKLPKIERNYFGSEQTFPKLKQDKKYRSNFIKNVLPLYEAIEKPPYKRESGFQKNILNNFDFKNKKPQIGDSCALNTAYAYHDYLDKKGRHQEFKLKSPNSPYDETGKKQWKQHIDDLNRNIYSASKNEDKIKTKTLTDLYTNTREEIEQLEGYPDKLKDKYLNKYQKEIEKNNKDQFKDKESKHLEDFAKKAGNHPRYHSFNPSKDYKGINSAKYLKGHNYEFENPKSDEKKDAFSFTHNSIKKGLPVILDLNNYGGPNSNDGQHNILGLGLKDRGTEEHEKYRRDKRNARESLLEKNIISNLPLPVQKDIEMKNEKSKVFGKDYPQKFYYYDPNYSQMQKMYLSEEGTKDKAGMIGMKDPKYSDAMNLNKINANTVKKFTFPYDKEDISAVKKR